MAVLGKLALLLVAVGYALAAPDPQSQDEKERIPAFDPQLLNYQLGQLKLQPEQYQQQQIQGQQYETQPVQFPTVQPQGLAQQGLAPQTQQIQQLEDQILQQRLLQSAYQAQFSGAPTGGIPAAARIPQKSDESSKQRFLGVRYSSAADASRTSFEGYGIKYSF